MMNEEERLDLLLLRRSRLEAELKDAEICLSMARTAIKKLDYSIRSTQAMFQFDPPLTTPRDPPPEFDMASDIEPAPARRRGHIGPDEFAEIIMRYQNGETPERIAYTGGRSLKSVYICIRKAGVARPQGRPRIDNDDGGLPA